MTHGGFLILVIVMFVVGKWLTYRKHDRQFEAMMAERHRRFEEWKRTQPRY